MSSSRTYSSITGPRTQKIKEGTRTWPYSRKRGFDEDGDGKNVWYENRDTLLKYGVIEEAESVGRSPIYRMDMDDPVFPAAGSARTRSGSAKRDGGVTDSSALDRSQDLGSSRED